MQENTPINVEEALERIDGDREFLKELANIFLQEAEFHLADIEEAIRTSETGKLQDLAHTIKGAAANISAERARNIASMLETAAREGDLAKAEMLTKDLETEIEEIRSFISQI